MTMKDLSFEAVVHQLMLEELAPSHEALVRWQKRYPKWRDSLAEYFADWTMDRELPEPGPDPEIDEAATVEKGVKYAMDILRREEGFVPKTSVEKLKPFDQLVLAAVFLLRGSGHVVAITERVSEMSGKRAFLASIFGSLSVLERKGLVESRPANPETESEKKDPRYFMATMAGERALAYAKATSQTIAGLLEDLT
jgi:hypothetical protein